MQRFGIMIIFIRLLIDGECLDSSTSSGIDVNMVKRKEPGESCPTRYFTSKDDIDEYNQQDIASKLASLGRSQGETVACCRHFSYFVHGRIFIIFQPVIYDGLIRDQQTGKQLVVKHRYDMASTEKDIVTCMIDYLTSLGEMNVKPCKLNYTYPLTSTDDACASGKSLSCDQQCFFQCPQGYTLSNTEPITCCDKGQFSSALPSCEEHGNIVRSTGKASSSTVLTNGHPDTTNTPTDKMGTDILKMSTRRSRNFLAFLSVAALFILIPVIYCVRKNTSRNKKIQYDPMDENTCASVLEGTDVEPDGRGSYSKYDVLPANPSPSQLDRNENYRMNVREKGLIYILNNKTFVLPNGETCERKGSEIDVENVKHVFEQIGYKAVVNENLTVQEIRQSLNRLKEQIKPTHPSVVLMFMSHGDEKGIKGVDLRNITVREIKKAFSGQRCSVLIGKPKLIFVQACRGEGLIKNVLESDWKPGSRPCSPMEEPLLERDGPEPQELELRPRDIVETDAAEADIAHYYIAQSTTEGYYSLRSRIEGSCFIQALCEELIKRVHEETLDTIMGLVTRRVQGRVRCFNGQKTLQVPQIIKQGIEKEIFLLPKYPQ